ncbi:MAG: hypothetical protein AB8B99_22105 [Phormidesmis sp.]
MFNVAVSTSSSKKQLIETYHLCPSPRSQQPNLNDPTLMVKLQRLEIGRLEIGQLGLDV